MGVNDATTGHALVERHQRIGTALDKPPKDRHMAVKKTGLRPVLISVIAVMLRLANIRLNADGRNRC